jgi:dinuclear metal center YbgI/SA1388 family protein
MGTSLRDIVSYLDSFLRIREIPDHARALNGLQLGRQGNVSRIAAAVDVCRVTIEAAAARRADLLLVHHGLFWGGFQPLTGVYGQRVAALIHHGIALYSAHLPLDSHLEVGNNILLARQLGLEDLVPFGHFEDSLIGYSGRCDLDRQVLADRLRNAVGSAPRMLATGPAHVRRVGVVTGAGSDALREAALEGLDTLITGEAPHHAYLDAEELNINLLLGGHYATETFGVRALAAHLESRFHIPWDFLDHPTGL